MENLPLYNWGKKPFGLAIFTPGKVWAKHFRKAFDSHGFFWYILNWFCSARVTNQEPHLLLVEPISYALYLRVNVFSTKVPIEDTIFTSLSRDETAILRGEMSHAKV